MTPLVLQRACWSPKAGGIEWQRWPNFLDHHFKLPLCCSPLCCHIFDDAFHVRSWGPSSDKRFVFCVLPTDISSLSSLSVICLDCEDPQWCVGSSSGLISLNDRPVWTSLKLKPASALSSTSKLPQQALLNLLELIEFPKWPAVRLPLNLFHGHYLTC